MSILESQPLMPFHTFRTDAKGRYLGSFSNLEGLELLLNGVYKDCSKPILIVGGGSNILFTGDYDGPIFLNCIKGLELVGEDEDYVLLKVGAGEIWNDLVMYCVRNNYGGIENLSLIPGKVGASPIQNIGAYGVELKDIFHSLEAFHLYDKQKVVFSSTDCQFGYRDSVFKNKYQGQFSILNITLRLSKHPRYNIGYAPLQREIERLGKDISLSTVAEAVINIRRSKLPDPAVLGNAGSFFKNPTINKESLERLQKLYIDIPFFPGGELSFKIPAAWLIEQCGWKGFRRGDVGCYPLQPLVLVNYGIATGLEIVKLSNEIVDSVWTKFNIVLEKEVNIL